VHHLRHIRQHAPAEVASGFSVSDVTAESGVLGLMGPHSRSLLSSVLPDEDTLLTENFPFGTAKELTIAGQRCWALRVSYVGELGWELHMPQESAVAVYEALCDADASGEHGMRLAGYRTLDNLRLEKGFVHWGHDITPLDTPLEAGLAWATKLKAAPDSPFLGREALLQQKAEGVTRRLLSFTVDPSVTLLGHECIYRDGARVGFITSGGFSHTLQQSLGIGYVGNDGKPISTKYLKAGRYELDVAGTRFPAVMSLSAVYDPKALKMRE